jgi:small basic protein (TIGR04137 family)
MGLDLSQFQKFPCQPAHISLFSSALPKIFGDLIMSQHPSFNAGGSGNKKKRNVLKRFERVSLLKRRSTWKEGDRVTGLVKTKPEE